MSPRRDPTQVRHKMAASESTARSAQYETTLPTASESLPSWNSSLSGGSLVDQASANMMTTVVFMILKTRPLLPSRTTSTNLVEAILHCEDKSTGTTSGARKLGVQKKPHAWRASLVPMNGKDQSGVAKCNLGQFGLPF